MPSGQAMRARHITIPYKECTQSEQLAIAIFEALMGWASHADGAHAH